MTVATRRTRWLPVTAAALTAAATALVWTTPAVGVTTSADAPSTPMLVTSAVTTASGGTEALLDAGWQKFTTAGGVGGTSVEGPYVFDSTKLTKVTVTDAYCHGDAFSVLDDGVSLGDTSTVPEELRTCPPRFYLSDTVRADASMVDTTFSHGVFYVAPGSHALEFVNAAIWNGTDTGSQAFFRLETVSLGMDDCLADGWTNFGTVFPNQGQCIALALALEHQTAANVGTVTFEASPFGTAARGLNPPEPTWHKWTGSFFNPTTYSTRMTTPITQHDPGREVLTVTVPVSLSGLGTTPDVAVATVTMTGQPQITTLVGLGQYGSLGNDAWELVAGPTISLPSRATTWTFRSTAPVTPGQVYDPIVVSFTNGNTGVLDVVYDFSRPATASVSVEAPGYPTGTGSGWYLPSEG